MIYFNFQKLENTGFKFGFDREIQNINFLVILNLQLTLKHFDQLSRLRSVSYLTYKNTVVFFF